MARYLKIPRLARIQVDGIYEPPDKRRRDAGNWLATYKAQIDGLVDAGVVEDDDHTRVHGPFPWIGDLFPMGRIVLVITELEPLTPQERPLMSYPHFRADCSDHHALVRDFNGPRPTITALCGSTRFRDEFARANRGLTARGVIVVAPG